MWWLLPAVSRGTNKHLLAICGNQWKNCFASVKPDATWCNTTHPCHSVISLREKAVCDPTLRPGTMNLVPKRFIGWKHYRSNTLGAYNLNHAPLRYAWMPVLAFLLWWANACGSTQYRFNSPKNAGNVSYFEGWGCGRSAKKGFTYWMSSQRVIQAKLSQGWLVVVCSGQGPSPSSVLKELLSEVSEPSLASTPAGSAACLESSRDGLDLGLSSRAFHLTQCVLPHRKWQGTAIITWVWDCLPKVTYPQRFGA